MEFSEKLSEFVKKYPNEVMELLSEHSQYLRQCFLIRLKRAHDAGMTYEEYEQYIEDQHKEFMDKEIKKSFKDIQAEVKKEGKKLVKDDIKRDAKCEKAEHMAKKKK